MSISVLLVDDHRLLRDALRRVLEDDGEYAVVGEGEDGHTAVELSRDLRPDVVVMDLLLPSLNGIDATRRIVADRPDAKVLALSAQSARRWVLGALEAGARGYVLKADSYAELRNAGYEIEKLKIQLATLRRDRYGRSSEKLAAEADQLEMLIGDLEEDQAEREAAAAEKERRTKGKSGNQRKPATRRPLPEHLPRETVVHEPVLACRCGCTDPARLTRLGESVTEVLEKFERHLSRCRNCTEYLAQYRATIDAGRAAYQDESATLPADVPEDLVQAILASWRR